jgi:isopentenyl diphosphate isomerase/L-lactate dehydrogenase-like FMN-dependent dehydrogenase
MVIFNHNLKQIAMTPEERNQTWKEIVARIDEIGEALQELVVNEVGDMISDQAESALYSLRSVQMELEDVEF